eukprot:11198530-Alexandrium_andersonii.AAC.1
MNLDNILRVGIRAPQDSDGWSQCTRPSRKLIHFLPYHPDDPRLATSSRLDKHEYDTVLQVDFRHCQFLGKAEFVATQNGYILANGHVPAQCVRRVEFSSTPKSGKRAWKRHKCWAPPPPDDDW